MILHLRNTELPRILKPLLNYQVTIPLFFFLQKSTSNSDSIQSDGVRSRTSPTSRTSQGHDTRNSPLGRTLAESPTSPHPSHSMPTLPAGRNSKSPVTKEVLSHFKPISRPSSEMSGRSLGVDQSASSVSVLCPSIFHEKCSPFKDADVSVRDERVQILI